MAELIAISGKIGSGKDSFAKIAQGLYPEFENKKYAYKLKEIASILTGVSMDKWEDQDFKKQMMPGDWGMTYRKFLQVLGTEGIRAGVHDLAWINALFSDFNSSSNWIITDCRFPNEAKAVKERGGFVIRITRPGEKEGSHASETALDNYEGFDYVIENDGTYEDLCRKVKETMDWIMNREGTLI